MSEFPPPPPTPLLPVDRMGKGWGWDGVGLPSLSTFPLGQVSSVLSASASSLRAVGVGEAPQAWADVGRAARGSSRGVGTGNSILQSAQNIPEGSMSCFQKGLRTAFLPVALADAGVGLSSDSFSVWCMHM